MGFTPDLVTGVWVEAKNATSISTPWLSAGGARTALPIYGFYMQKVYADKNFLTLKTQNLSSRQISMRVPEKCLKTLKAMRLRK